MLPCGVNNFAEKRARRHEIWIKKTCALVEYLKIKSFAINTKFLYLFLFSLARKHILELVEVVVVYQKVKKVYILLLLVKFPS